MGFLNDGPPRSGGEANDVCGFVDQILNDSFVRRCDRFVRLIDNNETNARAKGIKESFKIYEQGCYEL